MVAVSINPKETPRAGGREEARLSRALQTAADRQPAGTSSPARNRTSRSSPTRSASATPTTTTSSSMRTAPASKSLTPQGVLSNYFYGIEFSPRDLRFGLIEASDERIGTPIDNALLLCYHYDPATGKYGAAAIDASASAASPRCWRCCRSCSSASAASARRRAATRPCERSPNLTMFTNFPLFPSRRRSQAAQVDAPLLLHARRHGVLLAADRDAGRASSRSSTAAGTTTKSAPRSTARWRSSCSGRSSRSSSRW